MRISRSSALGAAGLALLAAALPALGQDKPESILPPGFDQPVAPAPPPPQLPADPLPPVPGPQPGATASATPTATPTPTPTPTAAPLARYELPDYARRSLARVGLAGAEGLPANAFGRADGRFLEALMRRTQAPVASRWLSIALRRALMSAVDTPAQVGGADFAAERAWLLLRMGEATGARAVVQGVDPDRATPKLIQVGMQAALATSDPAGMCPFVGRATALFREPGWTLARAMCLGLEGEPGQAGAVVDAVKRRTQGRSIDVLLAEKIVGAGSQGRRAVTIEWAGVDRITAWRYGLATASGVDIPPELFVTAGPQARYWRAVSPAVAPGRRAGDAEAAGAAGVLSNLALVDLYGEIEGADDNATAESGIARDLRAAYVGATAGDRVQALRGLWGEAGAGGGRYGRFVLTARAAARIRPGDARDDADAMVAAILSAGLDLNARRWEGYVGGGSDGWAMLALSDPVPSARLAYGDVTGFDGGDAKQRMLFAGLAGLGRLSAEDTASLADKLEVDLGGRDPWSRAIDAAARADQPGTVVLLCAAGMQTRDWRGVPPASLYRMVAALRATGLEGYARMIAAEAIARL